MEDVKKRMNKAFRYMRGKGLFARQNYLCCKGCANCAADLAIKESQAKGKTIIGSCYTTQQDCEVFREDNLEDSAYVVAALIGVLAMTKAGEPLPVNDEWDSPRTESGNAWHRLPRQARNYINGNLREDGTLDAGNLTKHIENLTYRCKIYLGFSGVDQPDGTETDTVAVGNIVQECLTKAGIKSVWDGSGITRICIPLLQDVAS